MDVKKPTTFEEQVDLIKGKGFTVEDDQQCIEFLNKANYYRLSAYLLPFRKLDKTYIQGINFCRVQNIYYFDSQLRALLFKLIEEIEFYLRTQLAYYHAHKYGSLGYLYPENFSKQHQSEIFKVKIEECIKENARTLVVKHHTIKYDGKFPIWVIIEYFSMGMLSYFYSDFITEDQKLLAKRLYGTTPNHLRSWLRCITDLRNRCAHYSRLYFWSFSAIPKIPNKFNYMANRHLFTQILMLMFLYPEQEKWNEVVVLTIKRLIEEFQDYICIKHIGFPDDWEILLHK